MLCVTSPTTGDNVKTPKALALGSALRRAREARGLSLRKLGERLGRDAGVLSRWETGDRTPTEGTVAEILAELGVNGDDYDEIMALTRGTDDRQWEALTLAEQRQQLAALLDFEDKATGIKVVGPLLIPGLLQDNGYVRAIMSAGGVPPGEVATRIATRIGRQNVLTRDNPVPLVALIGEAALCQRIGTPEVMAAQFRYLQQTAQRPNVDLRVVPFDSGWHPGLEGLFYWIDSPSEPQAVVHLENRRSGVFLHAQDDLDLYRDALDRVAAVAMNPEDSLELIAKYLHDRWETPQ